MVQTRSASARAKRAERRALKKAKAQCEKKPRAPRVWAESEEFEKQLATDRVLIDHFMRQIKDGCDWSECCTRRSGDNFKIACMLDALGGAYVKGMRDAESLDIALRIVELHGWRGSRLIAPYRGEDDTVLHEDYYGFVRVPSVF